MTKIKTAKTSQSPDKPNGDLSGALLFPAVRIASGGCRSRGVAGVNPQAGGREVFEYQGLFCAAGMDSKK